MSAIELQDLGIDELSVVDAPAHGMPGWMVMKSADGAVAEAEAQLASLYAAIGGARALEGAPEGVRKHAEALADYVEKQLTAEDPNTPLFERLRKSLKKRDKALEKQLDKMRKEVEKASDESRKTGKTAPADGDDDLEGAEEPDVQKALTEDTLEPVVKDLLDPVYEDVDVLREALTKALERIEAIEYALTGSDQAYGQEYDSVSKAAAPTFQDAILAAAAGHRVTLS